MFSLSLFDRKKLAKLSDMRVMDQLSQFIRDTFQMPGIAISDGLLFNKDFFKTYKNVLLMFVVILGFLSSTYRYSN